MFLKEEKIFYKTALLNFAFR